MANPESSPNNIYTVLILIALLALLGAIGFVWYRSATLFQSGNPLNVELSFVSDWVQAMRHLG